MDGTAYLMNGCSVPHLRFNIQVLCLISVSVFRLWLASLFNLDENEIAIHAGPSYPYSSLFTPLDFILAKRYSADIFVIPPPQACEWCGGVLPQPNSAQVEDCEVRIYVKLTAVLYQALEGCSISLPGIADSPFGYRVKHFTIAPCSDAAVWFFDPRRVLLRLCRKLSWPI